MSKSARIKKYVPRRRVQPHNTFYVFARLLRLAMRMGLSGRDALVEAVATTLMVVNTRPL